ncbi:ATP-dependent DNA ligase [Bradyrhizobium barranii]|jgi:bifunctional non-homologous end joining protein LigD|uniref:ATP-dependent DNA ligase n=1 Tax=Bradyrhizobium TaxID=374 RepID=UPI00339660F2
MRPAFEFCLPTAAKVVPAGPDWIHEITYDGYRLRVERQGKTVLFIRNGHDWTKRYPWIVDAALKNREQQFVIDGEAVVLGVDGASDSTPCTRASTITRCSSMRSTSSRLARTCASCQ